MIPFRDDVPARRYPIVTIGFILGNLLAFGYELTLPPAELQNLIDRFGVVPVRFEVATASSLPTLLPSLIGSMFLHGGWFHLFGNMWFLWIFGDNVEDRMGHLRFLFFYLLCGVVGSFAHILFAPGSAVPAIGASGAVAGVLGAYLVSYPFARVLTLVPLFIFWPIVELPAIVVLGSWFFIQLLNGMAAVAVTSETAAGVAWWAHVGGFLCGIALISAFARKSGTRKRKPAW